MEQIPEQRIVERKQFYISHEKMTLILCFVFVVLAFGGILLLASFGESPKPTTAAKNQGGELAPFPKNRDVKGIQYGPYNGPVDTADKKVTPTAKTTPTNTPVPEPTATPTPTNTPSNPDPTATPAKPQTPTPEITSPPEPSITITSPPDPHDEDDEHDDHDH